VSQVLFAVRLRWKAIALLVCVLLTGCFPTPTVPEAGNGTVSPDGIWVLCEGLWMQNNSSLSNIALSGTVVRDALRYVNNISIGDNPTHMVADADTLIIAVNTTRKILFVHKKTGELTGMVDMPGMQKPFKLCVRGRKLWCSNLNDDSITELDLDTRKVTLPAIHVGPAPEGMAAVRGKLYVALSGMGDLRYTEPGAGSVVVVNTASMLVQDTIAGLPNAAMLVADEARNRVWCSYRNLPSLADSLGGVVLIDVRADTIVQQWRFPAAHALSLNQGTGEVYVLHRNGIDKLTAGNAAPQPVASHTSGLLRDSWYSMTYNPASNTILVGNARGFLTDGEVIEFSPDGRELNRYTVGLNPGCILP